MKKPTRKYANQPTGIQDALRLLAEIRAGNNSALSNLRIADKLLETLVKHGPTKKDPKTSYAPV